MAANVATNGTAYYDGMDLPGPAAAIIAYTGHSAYSENDPATFTIAGDRDGIASPAVMERRVNAMIAAGIDVEFHVYPNLGHGFALGTGTSAEGWINGAVLFWEKHIKETIK
jgi:predicted esterase